MTAEAMPIEYRNTRLSNIATASLNTMKLAASKRFSIETAEHSLGHGQSLAYDLRILPVQ